jgi:hypothetical protein
LRLKIVIHLLIKKKNNNLQQKIKKLKRILIKIVTIKMNFIEKNLIKNRMMMMEIKSKEKYKKNNNLTILNDN